MGEATAVAGGMVVALFEIIRADADLMILDEN